MWWNITHLKKEILTHVTTRVKPEDITRGDMSQSEKDKHSVTPLPGGSGAATLRQGEGGTVVEGRQPCPWALHTPAHAGWILARSLRMLHLLQIWGQNMLWFWFLWLSQLCSFLFCLCLCENIAVLWLYTMPLSPAFPNHDELVSVYRERLWGIKCSSLVLSFFLSIN